MENYTEGEMDTVCSCSHPTVDIINYKLTKLNTVLDFKHGTDLKIIKITRIAFIVLKKKKNIGAL